MQTLCWDIHSLSSLPPFLAHTEPSLGNRLSLGKELSNLNGNLGGGPPLVTGGNACLLEDSYSI